MQIPIKSKIPKIISGIAATISLIALAWFFLSPFWFWVSLEIIAALLVAIGCSGEWWLHHHPAGRRKKEKDEHHKLESRFIAMVSLGVIMEIFALGHSIREGVKLENEVSEAKEHIAMLESTNLVLRSKVLELEAKGRWRTIMPEQKNAFIELTKLVSKFPIWVRTGPRQAETDGFAFQIRSMLDAAGFDEPDKTNGIAHWPNGEQIMYSGGLPEMPWVMFLINPTNLSASLNFEPGYWQTNWQDVFSSHPQWGTSGVPIIIDIIATNANVSSSSFVTYTNDRFIWHSIKGSDFFKSSHFPEIESDFEKIGITAGWMVSTNIPFGACEIFINPR